MFFQKAEKIIILIFKRDRAISMVLADFQKLNLPIT
jgi:hypothetical protein